MLFEEKQYFRQPLIWVVLMILFGIFTWGIVQQLILGKPFGENPAPDGVLILLGLFNIAIFLLFIYSNLQTIISEEEIRYRLSPLHRKFQILRWDEIDKAYIRKYRPILEYGGWGIRCTFQGGKAYNVSGNIGLQLVLKNGKKILIGTKKAEQMGNALKGKLNDGSIA